ncbi:hypothetical protein Pmar_PMAR002528 [Perkinsus marinus ATCC 50983]|uniref:Uncharacterized protein n=1 Tax=Perkinsus marinus (strain ATCC 50983 / TXsc) TaxID=423536 RepID=C5LV14_PERM5|nr:hypothetical protein Pmar_PMAR002528 [Perkinsus marinus ATCC 50983]EEQ99429.1 hypothetical protein Pmar_PMAR002528 [Perkinsus marinus ATCC 50983]|eukprot:XP_002766712.1 hypothetical protein Pmar_PMAR002528 [Perkinsus marinus ATCC 50983]
MFRLFDGQPQDRIGNAKATLQKQTLSQSPLIPGKLPGISDPEDREQPKTVMKSTIIGLQEITEEHTAVNRAEIIHKTLSRMEIVALVVTDSGSDVRQAGTKLSRGSRKAEDKDKADVNDTELDLDKRFRLENMDDNTEKDENDYLCDAVHSDQDGEGSKADD